MLRFSAKLTLLGRTTTLPGRGVFALFGDAPPAKPYPQRQASLILRRCRREHESEADQDSAKDEEAISHAEETAHRIGRAFQERGARPPGDVSDGGIGRDDFAFAIHESQIVLFLHLKLLSLPGLQFAPLHAENAALTALGPGPDCRLGDLRRDGDAIHIQVRLAALGAEAQARKHHARDHHDETDTLELRLNFVSHSGPFMELKGVSVNVKLELFSTGLRMA